MSSKLKLALGAAGALGVAALAYTKNRRIYNSDDKDSTQNDNKTEEKIIPASTLEKVDEPMVTLEEPSKEEKVKDAIETDQDEVMESSEGEEKQVPSASEDEIKPADSTNGKDD